MRGQRPSVLRREQLQFGLFVQQRGLQVRRATAGVLPYRRRVQRGAQLQQRFLLRAVRDAARGMLPAAQQLQQRAFLLRRNLRVRERRQGLLLRKHLRQQRQLVLQFLEPLPLVRRRRAGVLPVGHELHCGFGVQQFCFADSALRALRADRRAIVLLQREQLFMHSSLAHLQHIRLP